MNTLLGILHLLVILTHYRLLPDMSKVWKQTQTEQVAVVQTTSSSLLQIPTLKHPGFPLEAVRLDDKEKAISILYSQEPILYRFVKRQAEWPRRQSRSSKRYLVFCQLKTEG